MCCLRRMPCSLGTPCEVLTTRGRDDRPRRTTTRELPLTAPAGARRLGFRIPGRTHLPAEPGCAQTPAQPAQRGGGRMLCDGGTHPGPPHPSLYCARARLCGPRGHLAHVPPCWHTPAARHNRELCAPGGLRLAVCP